MSQPETGTVQRRGDRLLWAGAGAVVLVAAATFIVMGMGPSSGREEAMDMGNAAANASATGAVIGSADGIQREAGDGVLADRLALARLALDAGRLEEPADSGAWSLYLSLRRDFPDSAQVASGLESVAHALVTRASSDFTAGRSGKARDTLERLLADLPDFTPALRLRERMGEETAAARAQKPATAPTTTRQLITPVTIERVRPTAPVNTNARELSVARPAVTDPIIELHDAFQASIDGSDDPGHPLTDAASIVERMRQSAPLHARTAEAEKQLFDAYMSRAAAALDMHDTAAAQRWIDQASALNIDNAAVGRARSERAQLITALDRAATGVPVGELSRTAYAAPQYPESALERGIEGWVDIAFSVGTDGRTVDAQISHASHRTEFQEAALTALRDWTFEPYRIRGKPVQVRSQARIQFVLE